MSFTGHNVNDLARIKPTIAGLAIIEKTRAKELHPKVDFSTIYATDPDGWITMPLWEVMELFGSFMFYGGELPFEAHFTLQETPRI